MDPNACWNSIVQDICELNARTDIDKSMRKLAIRDLTTALHALAHWIETGGFLPALTLRNGGFVAERFNNGWSMVGTTTEKDPEPLRWTAAGNENNLIHYSAGNRFRIEPDRANYGGKLIWRLYDGGCYLRSYSVLETAKQAAENRAARHASPEPVDAILKLPVSR